MKRLVEHEGLQDGLEAWLAELLRAAGPCRVDPFRKRRIWVRLGRAPLHLAPRFWVGPGVAAALLASGSAGAALGHRYATGLGIVGPGRAERASVAGVMSTTRRPTTARSAAPSAVATLAGPADSSALTSSEPPPSRTQAKKTGAPRQPESGEDATHVLKAIQALRTEGDPARAQALLDDYLMGHARGALSSEALALSIEAAAARHDPRAADYARRYLAAYPKGKYRALATRALEKQY